MNAKEQAKQAAAWVKTTAERAEAYATLEMTDPDNWNTLTRLDRKWARATQRCAVLAGYSPATAYRDLDLTECVWLPLMLKAHGWNEAAAAEAWAAGERPAEWNAVPAAYRGGRAS